MRYLGFLSFITGLLASDPCSSFGEADGAGAISQGALGPTQDPDCPPVVPKMISSEGIATGSTAKSQEREGQSKTTSFALHNKARAVMPRARIQFTESKENIGFSLLLDTGSHNSYIYLSREREVPRSDHKETYVPTKGEPVERPAWYGEGLDLPDIARIKGEELSFGSPSNSRKVNTYGYKAMDAVMFSGENAFSFRDAFYLAELSDQNDEVDGAGIGLLGASPVSPFAVQAGVFSYLGQNYNRTTLWTSEASSAGTLLIGETDISVLNQYCREGSEIKFHSLRSDLSPIDWVVGGSVSIQTPDGTESQRSYMNWVVDTGSTTIPVTSEIKEEIKKAMVAVGAKLVFDQPGSFIIFSDCPTADLLPSLIFHMGTGTDAVSVVLTPADYFVHKAGVCFVDVNDKPSFTKDSMVIGMPVLSKLLTVFDAGKDRIGFCSYPQ
jgi:hypothetical protein